MRSENTYQETIILITLIRRTTMNTKKIKTLSIILAILLIIAAIGNIFLIINNKQAVWNVIAVAELLAVSTLLMVAAKYYDKAARGTK